MRDQKKLGFVGVKKQDICIYFAAILNNLGYRVLVEDLSYEQEILSCIPALPNSRPKIFYRRKESGTIHGAVAEENRMYFEKRTYKNVDYIGRTEEDSREYDYLLVNLGEWAQSTQLKEVDEIILVTDCEKLNIEKYQKFLQIFSFPMSLVIRNIHVIHRKNKILREWMNLQEWNLIEKYFLPFRLNDEEYRIGMQYEPLDEFRRISENMKAVLVKFCREYTENKLSEILLALSYAKNGKCS